MIPPASQERPLGEGSAWLKDKRQSGQHSPDTRAEHGDDIEGSQLSVPPSSGKERALGGHGSDRSAPVPAGSTGSSGAADGSHEEHAARPTSSLPRQRSPMKDLALDANAAPPSHGDAKSKPIAKSPRSPGPSKATSGSTSPGASVLASETDTNATATVPPGVGPANDSNTSQASQRTTSVGSDAASTSLTAAALKAGRANVRTGQDVGSARKWGGVPAVSGASSNQPTPSNQALPSAHMAAQAAAAAAAMAGPAAFPANGLGVFPSSSSSPVNPTSHQHLAQQSIPITFRQPFHLQASLQHQQHQQITMERFTAELTNCIIAFLSPILPTEEEYRIKEATRRQLERLAGKVSPGAKLLAFGSMANGFALKNSDMDLCCLIAGETEGSEGQSGKHNASQLVETLGKVLREETDYTVMPLPKARIPIIKISRPPTPELPYDIACDIGFENRLALENTRLLLSYAMVDPPRLRTLVLFLKVWTKRRKLNSPYTGTLSSYGYTLMMIFFLMHVKQPSVLPNLQRISPPASSKSTKEGANLNGHNTYFYDDVATLRKEWTSLNTENVGELLLDFFKYFSKEFSYSRDVISVRTELGVLPKDGKAWSAELCIEDPFQLGYNVARTVTKDGLYTIRGEFMRASRILTTRTDRVSAALAELCEDREDGLTRAPDPSHYSRMRHAVPAPFFNPALYLANGGFDPRYLRDLTRRFEAGSIASGFGGSFAFEEMARGLAQAQQGSTAMAFPPTTAMLAPLSQNVGLSPRQSLMRAGLRYDTPRHGQPVYTSTNPVTGPNIGTTNNISNNAASTAAHATSLPPSSPRILSSARSEDGGPSTYERRKSKRWNGGYDPRSGPTSNGANASADVDRGNFSARTSPRLNESVPQGLLHPDSALSAGYGIGEAFAYGSEISFGSQRFQLYPQLSKRQNSTSEAQAQPFAMNTSKPRSPSVVEGGSDGASVQQRSSRSFSDGLNRSKSLPRSALNGEMQSPADVPTSEQNSVPHSTIAKVPAGPAGSTNTSASAAQRPIRASFSSESSPTHDLDGMTQRLASQSANGSPYLTSMPWSYFGSAQQDPAHLHQLSLAEQLATPYAGSSHSLSVAERESITLDYDEHASLSDGTLDELARASAVDSSTGDDYQPSDGDQVGNDQPGCEANHTIESVARPAGISEPTIRADDAEQRPAGKEDDVRSWAASQRHQLDNQRGVN